MTSLHVVCGLAHLIQNPGYPYALNHEQCAYQLPVVASLHCYTHLYEWLLTILQKDVALLPVQKFFGMEVKNGIWKKILVWNGISNGRFLVWNGNDMEENCQYGLWKNHLLFHSIPFPVNQFKLERNIAKNIWGLRGIFCNIMTL